MMQHLPNDLDKISQFRNAVFYCMNESSDRVPVGVVHSISVLPDNKLEFQLSHFPVLENSWNVFAGELSFYQKGLPFNMKVHGTAWFANKDDLTIQFKILHIESYSYPDARDYSFQTTLTDFFNSTSLFFKKMLVTGF